MNALHVVDSVLSISTIHILNRNKQVTTMYPHRPRTTIERSLTIPVPIARMEPHSITWKGGLAIVATLLLSPALEAAELHPISVEQFLISPGHPHVLRWKADSEAAGSQLKASMRDYERRVISESTVDVTDDGDVRLSIQLPAGFYEIEFSGIDQQFGLIVATPPNTKRDAFFAIDSALSWLVSDQHTRQGLIRFLKKCGITMSRERLNWAQIQPSIEQWNWDSPQRYETLRQSYRRDGIRVLDMFHGTAKWAGRVGKYPEDLVGTAGSWKEIMQRFQSSWGAFEVWNEPDISFGGHLPADQYMALVKTFSYLFQQQPASVPLVGGVFAHHHPQFLDNAARNHLLDAVSVVSFHTYDRAPSMEHHIQKYRQWAADHGHARIPLWITECGRPWKRGPARPPFDQGAQSALDIVMKAVESRACGISRYFAFVFPYYEERESNFGMMGRAATPLRSMSAYVQLVNALSHKKYVGDLVCQDDQIQRARVFADEKSTIAVLYTGKLDATAKVRISAPVQKVIGIDGRTLDRSSADSVPIPDGLTYVELDRQRLNPYLEPNTLAKELSTPANSLDTKPKPASPVVLRYQIDPDVVVAKTDGYEVSMASRTSFPFTFRLFNLSSQPQQRDYCISASQPIVVEDQVNKTVSLPAKGYRDLTWHIDLRQSFTATGHATLSVTSAASETSVLEQVEIDLTGIPSIEQLRRPAPSRDVLPILDLAAWRKNIASTGEMKMTIDSDNIWQLNAEFQGGDRWVYPSFDLPKDVRMDHCQSIVVRARCHNEATVRMFLWEGDSGVGYLSGVLIPSDGEWHVAMMDISDFTLSGANTPDQNHQLDLDSVRKIAIGMNSEVDENRLEVSDIIFLNSQEVD
jgi:hypothetical protein